MITVDNLLRYNCIPIDRRCPACHLWNRHDTAPRIGATTCYQATCANCGHVWPCRITGADRLALRREIERCK